MKDALSEELKLAIVGLAGRFPGASSADALWEGLRDGKESLQRFDREALLAAGVSPDLIDDPSFVPVRGVLDDADRFDAELFGFSPREAEVMDPQQRVFLECTWHALEDAGLAGAVGDAPVGVFAGVGLNTYLLRHLQPARARLGSLDDFQIMILNDKDTLPTRVAYKLGLTGPAVNVQTSCSTGLVAVHLAAQSLLTFECDVAIAGASAIKFPQVTGHRFQPDSILSPDGHCRAFDVKAAGTIGGSGCGVVVIKRLADALADGDRIRAVIRGSAINNDGRRKVSFAAPSVAGQAEVIAAAHQASLTPPDTITFVEGHGTATPVGDPIEVRALTKAFRAQTAERGFAALGSIKTNIGHLDSAAGIAGLIKTVLALEHRQIPPTLHFTAPNPELELDSSPFFVNSTLIPWSDARGPRRAGVSSFGVGGTNAHVVLEEAPSVGPSGPARRPWQVWPYATKSARATEALEAALDAHAAGIEHPQTLADAAFTLQSGHRDLPYRGARIETVGKTQATFRSSAARTNRPVVFAFSGQGSQRAGMGRDLIESEPVFREAVQRAADLVRTRLDVDLVALFSADPDDDVATRQLLRTDVAQSALFVFEHALAQLWRAWGVEPAAVVGHSVGELVAACLADVLSFEDALALVITRGELMRTLPPGGMSAVRGAPPATLPEGLSIAAINEPRQWVASGPTDALTAYERALELRGEAFQRLATAHAFHGVHVRTLRAPFEAKIEAFAYAAPRCPMVSCVTGAWLESAPDAAFWGRHLADPVRFADAVSSVRRVHPDAVWLEIGPRDTLARLVVANHPEASAVASCGASGGSVGPAVAQLWTEGVDLDWSRLRGDERRRRVPMPSYPLDHRARYFIEATSSSPAPSSQAQTVADWFKAPTWQPAAPAHATEDRAGVALVIATHRARSRALAEAFERSHEAVVEIVVEATVASLEDALAHHLEVGPSPRTVVFATPMDLEDGLDFDAVQSRALHPIVSLARAMERKLSGESVRLLVATQPSLGVGIGDEDPARATIPAAALVLAQELAVVDTMVVDSDEDDVSRWASAVAAEASAAVPEPLVAYRRGQRWTRTFAPLATSEGAPAARLRANGTYVVLGGLGSFGRLCAKRIANVEGAHVALIDVRAPEDGDLDALRTGSYSVHTLDISDARALAEAFVGLRAERGAIDGVIHAAGCPEALCPIGQTTPEEFERHFAAKVRGTLALEAALGGAPIDFVLLVGSLASTLGGLGHAAYAASNAYLDAFASNRGAPWCSAAIETWALDARAPAFAGGASRAELAMSATETEEVFARVVDVAHYPRVLVAAGDLAARLERWVSSGAEAPVDSGTHARPENAAEYVAPRTETESRLSRIWSDVLGVAPIGLDDGFFELGGDSLLATQVVAKARQEFAVELPLRRLFETPTLRSFCEVVSDELKGELSAEDQIAALLAEVENEAPPVVVDPPVRAPRVQAVEGPRDADLPTLSVFFFSDDGAADRSERYRFVLDVAAQADRLGFHAVWTPERHFHTFGGLYASPSVLGAALAARTERIGIRAGSVVLPLHHPIRVTEEWAVLDNLSGGRVGVAFAAGWVPEDFALGSVPFEDRRAAVFERADQVQRLWRGEKLSFAVPGRADQAHVSTFPPPLQDDLPIWITTSGSRATWEAAGRAGYRVLTGLLQNDLDQVAENVAAYKAARRDVGLDPEGGWVTLMMHTHVGTDLEDVRNRVRGPLLSYLANHLDIYSKQDMLRKNLPVDPDALTEDDRAAIAELAFSRYFESNGLFGTIEDAERILRRVGAAGVQEVGCLLDYGVSPEDVESSLTHLATLLPGAEDTPE